MIVVSGYRCNLMLTVSLGLATRNHKRMSSIDELYYNIQLVYNNNFIVITSGVMPLQQLSMSAIISALLQQRSLEPDQLQVTLPGYVPPRIKHSITSNYFEAQIPLDRYPSSPPTKRVRLM